MNREKPRTDRPDILQGTYRQNRTSSQEERNGAGEGGGVCVHRKWINTFTQLGFDIYTKKTIMF